MSTQSACGSEGDDLAPVGENDSSVMLCRQEKAPHYSTYRTGIQCVADNFKYCSKHFFRSSQFIHTWSGAHESGTTHNKHSACVSQNQCCLSQTVHQRDVICKHQMSLTSLKKKLPPTYFTFKDLSVLHSSWSHSKMNDNILPDCRSWDIVTHIRYPLHTVNIDTSCSANKCKSSWAPAQKKTCKNKNVSGQPSIISKD